MDKLFTRDEHGNLRLYDFMVQNPMQLSIGDLADLAVARGELGTFDFALPIQWADDVRAKTGKSPFGIVWSYPGSSIFGEPFALTNEGAAILAEYAARQNDDAPLGAGHSVEADRG